MPKMYQIENNDLYRSVFNAIADYNESQGYKPELLVISNEVGDVLAQALSAGLMIAVMLDEHTAPEQFILTMLPEAEHE